MDLATIGKKTQTFPNGGAQRQRRRNHRLRVYNRDSLCAYCLQPVEFDDSTMDHIVPKSRGGGNEPDNLALCCKLCNELKRSNTPLEFLYLGGQELAWGQKADWEPTRL